ncbi:hypothetical protein [Halorubrum kocurii]|nr:hypothetical protein [Halorubrum kocurii]
MVALQAPPAGVLLILALVAPVVLVYAAYWLTRALQRFRGGEQ